MDVEDASFGKFGVTTTSTCRDVTWFARHIRNHTNQCYSAKMAESQNPTHKTTRRGGKYCVAGLPNNVSCTNTSYTVGISMHRFPKNPETRQKWVKVVRKRRLIHLSCARCIFFPLASREDRISLWMT